MFQVEKDPVPSGKFATVAETRQIVTFNIGKEKFGVDILKIKEIIRLIESTRVPNTPDFVEGVINLRGGVIPIIDVRSRFGLPRKKVDKNTRIMVFELKDKIVGFVVDRVNEVIRIPINAIEPPPDMISGIETKYITGIAVFNNQMIILIELEEIISFDEKKVLSDSTV